MTIEVSDEILGSRTSERTTRVDVAHQHPLLLTSTTDRQAEQVRTLPDATMITIFGSKATLHRPLLQIGRRINLHLLTNSQQHDPALSLSMPEQMRIAEIRYRSYQHGVTTIFLKCLSTICRIGHRLCLSLTCRCIIGNDGTFAKTGGVLLIYYARTAEDCTQSVSFYSRWLSIPVNQVSAGRSAPGHVLPL